VSEKPAGPVAVADLLLYSPPAPIMPPLIEHDVPLARHHTFGIDVRAKHFVRVESDDALAALLQQPLWSTARRLVLGGGSNVLFTRDFDGLIVQIAMRGITRADGDGDAHLVVAAAGEPWDGFVRTTVARGWPGLENLALIPGCVGAAPVQNIGAYGIELAERFAWLEAFDLERGEIRRMEAADCAFGYRDSVFKHALAGRTAILRVAFHLPRRWTARRGYADIEKGLVAAGVADPTPTDMLDLVTNIRRAKLPDPAVIGNAGSFFKNPVVDAATFARLASDEPGIVGYPEPDGGTKLAAGWLIDRLGWRGRALPGAGIDGASVHDRQALVLVNRGRATGGDVLALATAIRDDVAARFGVALEMEPVVV
jgi:UDP-N-acetylmuramate dehydrogenase